MPWAEYKYFTLLYCFTPACMYYEFKLSLVRSDEIFAE